MPDATTTFGPGAIDAQTHIAEGAVRATFEQPAEVDETTDILRDRKGDIAQLKKTRRKK